MEQDKAAKLDGMVLATRMLLESLADYIRENVPDARRREIMLKVGTAMAELIDISRMIYDDHPRLNPYAEEEEIAARLRGSGSPAKPTD